MTKISERDKRPPTIQVVDDDPAGPGVVETNERLRREIDERERAVEALRESEARFRALFSKSRDANMLMTDGVLVECNEAALEMLQVTREQVIGKSPAFLAPDWQPDGSLSVEAAWEKAREVMKTGSGRFEWVLRRMDGTEFWTEVTAAPINIDGKDALFGAFRDITERKRAEEALQESEERFALAMRGANDGLWDWNLEAGGVYFSPRWKSMLGYAEHEVEPTLEAWKRL
ncbi:MAG: PAS domain S-box protein, partial [Desulfobacterales bacterium]|nr:PAS domain S-box protein [Desulfobacterales bacterium]